MIRTILRTTVISLALAAIIGAPAPLLAQTPEKPAADTKTTTKEPSEKKPSPGVFHGKLAKVDQTAKTITVGKRTYLITKDSRLFKAGKEATLADGVVNEEVSGYGKLNTEGKLYATKVNFGPKAETKAAETKPANAKAADAKKTP